MADHVGKQLSNYRLLKLIGSGGFADVYVGEHIYLGTQAAIKVVSGQLSLQEEEEFKREARTLAQLIHPNIVRLLEFGLEQNKIPYLIMDYAPNGSLRDHYPQGAQLPLPSIISYVKQIANALQMAHDKKVIHRDIKPQNILLGPNNEVWLSDFGIAVIAHSTRSQKTQNVIGTVDYMAPEQINAHPSQASDQYALGVVVYEWLSGTRPFDGTGTEIAIKHLSVPPPPLRTKNPSIAPDVEQVVLKALAKEPQQRFARIMDFADALEQATQATLLKQPLAPLAPTVPVWNTAAPIIVQANAPSQQLIVPQPTDQDIYKALLSPVNPYAIWGTLVYDDSEKHMWEPEESYTGNVFNKSGTNDFWNITMMQPSGLLPVNKPKDSQVGNLLPRQDNSRKGFLRGFLSPKPVQETHDLTSSSVQPQEHRGFKNFAFQIQIRIIGEGEGGIIFRSDQHARLYYWFNLNHKGYYFWAGSNRLAFNEKCSALRPNKPNLIAVVAEEATTHLYINLELVESIYDTSILHAGLIGISAVRTRGSNSRYDSHYSIEYSYGKLWEKIGNG